MSGLRDGIEVSYGKRMYTLSIVEGLDTSSGWRAIMVPIRNEIGYDTIWLPPEQESPFVGSRDEMFAFLTRSGVLPKE